MIARKQEISLQLNQSIDALPGAPAALLRKERIDIAHAAMRLRRGESGECFILAGRAHKPPEFLRSVSRVVLTFSLIKLDKVRRAFGACEFESVAGSREATSRVPAPPGNEGLAFMEDLSRRSSCARLSPARKNQHTPVWPAGTETSGRQT